MARIKTKWRRVLTARFLRWWLACQAVRLFPRLGVVFGFFPWKADMIEAADEVLADEHDSIAADSLVSDLEFLRRCRAEDAADPSVELTQDIPTGRRTALYDHAWIDMSNGSILLPEKRQTVLVRGSVVNWNATSVRFNRSRVRVDGCVMPLLNTANYFHLILENGLRVIDLLESGVFTGRQLTLAGLEKRGLVDAALYDGIVKLYPDVVIRRFPEHALLVPEQTICHFPRDPYWEWPPFTLAHTERLLDAFEQVYGPCASHGPDRLYLSRRNAKHREPTNRDALEALLTANGFQALTASDENHADQIAGFRNARTIVAVHGAGLTNLLFCRPGTRVIEIFPSNFVKSPYWWIARKLGLEHIPVYGGAADYNHSFKVDLGAVEDALSMGDG